MFALIAALVISGAALADEAQQKAQLQLPQQYQQQIVKQLQAAGEEGQDLPAARERRLDAAHPTVSHHTYCQGPSNGYIEAIQQEGAFNPRLGFKVSVKGQDGQWVEATDAKTKVTKHSLFDNSTSDHWGLGGHSRTVTNAFAVKMTIKSEKHVLGTKIEGCIGRPVHEIEVVMMCFHSATTWLGRP